MFNKYFQNLANIKQYLTNTENQFYKVSVISVKHQLSIGLHRLYWLLIISLLEFLPYDFLPILTDTF